MNDTLPKTRRDLEFFPLQYEGKRLVLVRDHLGLVTEGKAVALPLYQILALLDGTRSVRDLQMVLMREQQGVLVGMDQVNGLLAELDEAFMLDSERYWRARDHIVADFSALNVRPCSHCGKAYPENPHELDRRLDDILSGRLPGAAQGAGRITALIAPHIDLTVGGLGYAAAYQQAPGSAPRRVVVLGVGHQMENDLFCLTEKDFETPLGLVRTDRPRVENLIRAGGDVIAPNDFAHRSEHSIEFQLLFLQHLFKDASLQVVPVLCGFLPAGLPVYTRKAYLERARPFLKCLAGLLAGPEEETLLVAGVDFSHVGPKFGHEKPARHLTHESEAHDGKLLDALCALDAEKLWEESRQVEDRFNVCGFSALACLCEVLPPSRGRVLHYETWHEEATRSSVSFAAACFEAK